MAKLDTEQIYNPVIESLITSLFFPSPPLLSLSHSLGSFKGAQTGPFFTALAVRLDAVFLSLPGNSFGNTANTLHQSATAIKSTDKSMKNSQKKHPRDDLRLVRLESESESPWWLCAG